MIKSELQNWLEENENNTKPFWYFLALIDVFVKSVYTLKILEESDSQQKDRLSFEFGCYLLQKADFWLWAHENKNRHEIMSYLSKNFIETFSEFLKIPTGETNNFFQNRMSLHEKLAKRNRFGTTEFDRERFENYFGEIADLVLSSEKEVRHISENINPVLDLSKRSSIAFTLISYETNTIESLFELLEKL